MSGSILAFYTAVPSTQTVNRRFWLASSSRPEGLWALRAIPSLRSGALSLTLPPLTDAKSFAVSVVTRPLILSATLSNTTVTVIWSAMPGQSYRLQSKQHLEDILWNDLAPDVTASDTTASSTDSIGAGATRFYRVRLLP